MSFAPITEEFDELFARTLPPAAKTLWGWLRRQAPAGREVEFCLQDFVQKFGYSLKWGRKALTILIENGLVEEVKKFYGYGFRVIVHQIGELGKKASSNSEETSINGNETSQKPPENPHPSVNTNKEKSIANKTKQELPTHHPVALTEKPIITPQKIAQDPKHQELLQKAQNLGVHLNQNLTNLIANNPPEIVRSALAALEEQIQSGKNIASREGYLSDAIRRCWKPNAERRAKRSAPATAIPAERQATVIADYQRIGYDPNPGEVAPAPAASQVEDLSDSFVLIQINIRRLGWDKSQVEAVLQERYGKSKQRLLCDAELQNWAAFLVECESIPSLPKS